MVTMSKNSEYEYSGHLGWRQFRDFRNMWVGRQARGWSHECSAGLMYKHGAGHKSSGLAYKCGAGPTSVGPIWKLGLSSLQRLWQTYPGRGRWCCPLLLWWNIFRLLDATWHIHMHIWPPHPQIKHCLLKVYKIWKWIKCDYINGINFNHQPKAKFKVLRVWKTSSRICLTSFMFDFRLQCTIVTSLSVQPGGTVGEDMHTEGRQVC